MAVQCQSRRGARSGLVCKHSGNEYRAAETNVGQAFALVVEAETGSTGSAILPRRVATVVDVLHDFLQTVALSVAMFMLCLHSQ